MNQQQHHWVEKLQLQVVVTAALAAVYLVLWSLFRSPDPDGALAFLANGSYGAIGLFAVVFWILAASCAAVTFTGRGEAALIASLIGTGGLSLHSGQMRALLWNNMAEAGVLYWKLIVEIAVLAMFVLVADAVIGLVRSAIRRLKPGWVWTDPLSELPPQVRAKLGKAPPCAGRGAWLADAFAIRSLVAVFRRLAYKGRGKARKPPPDRELFAQAGSFLGAALVIAVVIVMALMRSAQRGQILFALLAGFFLAVLIAHQLFPSPAGRAAWVLPVVLAVCAYALAAASAIGSPPQGWIEVRNYARALPLDWLTAGGGGAMLGYWVSARMHEARYFEKKATREGK